MCRFGLVLFMVFVLGPCAAAAPPGGDAAPGHMKLYTARDSNFETVRQDLELAITARGMVVNNVAHIGEMLKRTGADLGAERSLYGKAEALEFCSAALSRRMMAADPANIVFCPYVITIYTLPDAPATVHVAFRRPTAAAVDPASRAVLQEVEDLLSSLAEEAVSGF